MDDLNQRQYESIFEVFDLSIVEILITKFIEKYDKPVKRFQIYQDFNLQIPESKKLAPSKFYYKLEKLSRYGLIKLDQDDKNNLVVLTVKDGSWKINAIITSLVMNSIDFDFILSRLIEEFLKNIEIPNLGNVLIIKFDPIDHSDVEKIKAIIKQSDVSSLMIDPKAKKYLGSALSTFIINYTDYIENVVRQPDNYFDTVLLYGSDYGEVKDLSKLFMELVRVLKIGGVISLIPYSDFVYEDNFLIEGLGIKNLVQGKIEKGDLVKYISPDLISKSGCMNYKGIILDWVKL